MKNKIQIISINILNSKYRFIFTLAIYFIVYFFFYSDSIALCMKSSLSEIKEEECLQSISTTTDSFQQEQLQKYYKNLGIPLNKRVFQTNFDISFEEARYLHFLTEHTKPINALLEEENTTKVSTITDEIKTSSTSLLQEFLRFKNDITQTIARQEAQIQQLQEMNESLKAQLNTKTQDLLNEINFVKDVAPTVSSVEHALNNTHQNLKQQMDIVISESNQNFKALENQIFSTNSKISKLDKLTRGVRENSLCETKATNFTLGNVQKSIKQLTSDINVIKTILTRQEYINDLTAEKKAIANASIDNIPMVAEPKNVYIPRNSINESIIAKTKPNFIFKLPEKLPETKGTLFSSNDIKPFFTFGGKNIQKK